jgi:shikimate dehydrogenase
MHSAALVELGLAEEWSYEAIDLAPDEFEPRVRAMADEGFVGANVTVPHKGAALSLADSLSETAREIGAANTLSFAGGEIRADNTDAQGLMDALPKAPGGKRALVLGAVDLRSYELVVNSTSVGLHGENPFAELPFEPSDLEERHTVVDLVYGAAPSQLLTVAFAVGAGVVDGIEILVRQGALSLEIWTDQPAPLEIMRRAAFEQGPSRGPHAPHRL